MPPFRRAPQRLKYVAYLFLIQGFSSMASMVAGVLAGKVNINLGVLCVPIGWGLLKLNPNSYRWAKFWCKLCLWLTPLALLTIVTGAGQFKVMGAPLTFLPTGAARALALVWLAIGVGVILWQLNVLNSEPVQRTFAPHVETGELP